MAENFDRLVERVGTMYLLKFQYILNLNDYLTFGFILHC